MQCPYFKKCGGCSYLDLSEQDYVQLKLNFVKNALLHEEINFPISELMRIPTASRRRATFAYSNGTFGFNASKSHEIIAINSCPLLLTQINLLLPALRNFASSWEGQGDVSILFTQWGADISVLPHENKIRFKHRKKIKAKSKEQDILFLEEVNEFCRTNHIARFCWNNALLYQETSLPFPSNVFMQPSLEGENTLIGLVLKACQGSQRILDLFCGLGTFTKPLTQEGYHVEGFDITKESIQQLTKENYSAQVRDLFRFPLSIEELNQFDTAVLDPARAGAKEQCMRIAQSNLKKVVMISCNPITFARDCRILLNSGFNFQWITPVDQFPFTQHIEVAALLIK